MLSTFTIINGENKTEIKCKKILHLEGDSEEELKNASIKIEDVFYLNENFIGYFGEPSIRCFSFILIFEKSDDKNVALSKILNVYWRYRSLASEIPRVYRSIIVIYNLLDLVAECNQKFSIEYFHKFTKGFSERNLEGYFFGIEIDNKKYSLSVRFYSDESIFSLCLNTSQGELLYYKSFPIEEWKEKFFLFDVITVLTGKNFQEEYYLKKEIEISSFVSNIILEETLDYHAFLLPHLVMREMIKENSLLIWRMITQK